jgi:hypothetical protein
MKMKFIFSVLLLIMFAGIVWISASGNPTVHAKSVFNTPDSSSINWDKMDHAARMALMKKVVMPTMRAEFAKFNPDKFAKMNCKTCHGAGAMDDSFKMPNPQIWKLPNSKEGWGKADTNFVKFMRFTVKPKMAALLGMKEFDMQTKTGFGCGNCHTEQK